MPAAINVLNGRTIFAVDMYPARANFSPPARKSFRSGLVRRTEGTAAARCSLGCVRLTVFWDRMNAQFGEAYAQSVAKDFVLAGLGGRTVDRALADGEDVKRVWHAVCESFEIPDSRR